MRRLASILIVVAWLAAGCASGHPERDDDVPPPESTPAAQSGPGSSRPYSPPPRGAGGPGGLPGASPSPTGFGELTAVPCGGRPSGDQVIALLQRRSVLAAGSRPAVTTGPMCAGTWQYTVVSVSSHEPLHAVSKGPPTALELVTAGTNPCSARVRAEAPPGILALIQC